jgi:uncharacterized protein
MARFLILLLLIGVVLWFVFGRSRSRQARQADKPRDPVAFATCVHCGVHLPQDDAVMDGGRAYCSEAHRLAGPKDHGSG